MASGDLRQLTGMASTHPRNFAALSERSADHHGMKCHTHAHLSSRHRSEKNLQVGTLALHTMVNLSKLKKAAKRIILRDTRAVNLIIILFQGS
eukprot:c24788_g1_i6 orf=121-399(-)